MILFIISNISLAKNLEYTPCPFVLPYGEELGKTIHCGSLTVPANRADHQSPQLKLAFAVLSANKKFTSSDPIIYLHGGPGGAALNHIDQWAKSLLRQKHDLILFDQRGTGYSSPILDCKEFNDKAYHNATVKEIGSACLKRLKAQGISPENYNSRESASDVDDLRKALNLKKVNLYGISYGTRLALTVMRDHPKGIRSVVLDSAYPPNVARLTTHPSIMQHAFNRLFAECRADQACHRAYPNLEAHFYAMLENLNKKPYILKKELYGLTEDQEITALDYADSLFRTMYYSYLIRDLPEMISIATKADFDISYAWLQKYISPNLTEGVFYSIECYEDASFKTEKMIIKLSQGVHPSLRQAAIQDATNRLELCQLWSPEPADIIENEAVVSDIPTLVLAGSLDPVTPPAWGKLAAKSLSKSQFVLFPGLAHGLLDKDDCPDQIIANFLDHPERRLNTSCTSKMKAVFSVPE